MLSTNQRNNELEWTPTVGSQQYNQSLGSIHTYGYVEAARLFIATECIPV